MASTTMDSMTPAGPGSYLFQHDHGHSSIRSHSLFQPPAPSPTPSYRTSQIPRPVSRSSNSFASRKRPRLDTNTSYFSRPTRPSISSRSNTVASTTATTPFDLSGSYDKVSFTNLSSSVYSLDDANPLSPSPLANSEYRLAGGLDTPGASFEQGLDDLARDEAEKDYRFNRYTSINTSGTISSANNSGQLDSQTHIAALDPTNVGNSRKRTRSPNERHAKSLSGWGIRSTAWALTGGLAGKVFNFCINTAFGGFRAGGGDSYRMSVSTFENDGENAPQIYSRSSLFSDNYDKDFILPGEYPHDIGGFVEDYMNSPESRRQHRQQYRETTPIANHQTWDDRSNIKNDWQLVDQVILNESDTEHSPARKRSRASVAGAWQRPVSRGSMNGRVNTTGASYASPRARASSNSYSSQRTNNGSTFQFQPVRRIRPSMANSRKSTSYLSGNVGSASLGQTTPERPSSSASLRQTVSDLSPEVVTYKRKMKEQDKNLKRVNSQVVDMIREAKEALGSKVEIFDEHGHGHEDFDEGYSEYGWK